MTHDVRPWSIACAAILLVTVAMSSQEPVVKDRFELFGREASIRSMIAEGFKEVTREEIGEFDSAQAADATYAAFRSMPRSYGQRWGQEHLHRKKVGELSRGYAVLQVRAGAGGGNPNAVYLNGKTSNYVDAVSKTPLRLGGPVDMHEKATAYFQAGHVPRGKVFVIKSIEYWGTAQGDSNGHGEFLVRVPGVLIEQVKDAETVPRKKWKGRVVVRPGLEDQVCLEVANSSQGEAIFRGVLVEEKHADPAIAIPFSEEQKSTVDRLLVGLDAELIDKREAAMKGIVQLGPGVIEYLKMKHVKARSAELKARIASMLEEFGEDP